MNTHLQTKTLKDSSSFEVQDSYKSFNRNANFVTSALVKHKEGYVEKTKKTTNRANLNGQLVQSKDTTPRIQVSVEFAAKQLFQILLVDIKYRNNKLEPIPSAICGQLSEN